MDLDDQDSSSSPLQPRRSTRLADRFHAHDHDHENDQEANHADSEPDEDELSIYEIDTPSESEDEAGVRGAYRLPAQTASKLHEIYEASAAEHKRLRTRVLAEQRMRLQGVLEGLEQGVRDERAEVAIGRLRRILGYDVDVQEVTGTELEAVVEKQAQDMQDVGEEVVEVGGEAGSQHGQEASIMNQGTGRRATDELVVAVRKPEDPARTPEQGDEEDALRSQMPLFVGEDEAVDGSAGDLFMGL